MKNIFYFNNINVIGGVETFFYYISKKYKDKDITIYYTKGDAAQIKRLKKYVRVKKYNGEIIECKKAFFNYEAGIIDNIEADEYIQIIHEYFIGQGTKPKLNPKITKYVGVSKLVCECFTELTGIPCELMYNPVEIDEPKNTLLIVSATRLTEEKGKDNIIKIGDKLNKLGKPYLWLIFTDSQRKVDNPNIVYMEPRLDILSFLKKADIVAQLSKSEAFGFTPNEALMVGTPVLLTDLPIWKELKIKNGVHGWIIKDIDKFDVSKLYEKIPEFTYNPPKDSWNKLLAAGKSQYQLDLKTIVKVKCIHDYNDIELGVLKTKDSEPYYINKARADELVEYGDIEIIEGGENNG